MICQAKINTLVGASANWNNLAVLTKSAGKPADAENWYHKALAVLKAIGDQLGASRVLSNLADLLRNESSRLTEARQLAEQALAIKQTLDPTAADSAQRSALEAELEEWAEAGLGKLVAALRRLLDGERDEEALGEGLDRKDWLIVHAILRELAEPGSLEALLAGPPQER